jgi:cyclopropane fatty-acyl-phospholipid synthase-like methyltransferase
MESFKEIKKTYSDSFKEHGDSIKTIFTPKGRNDLRYSYIKEYVDKNTYLDILDYGCGLGYLCNYLSNNFKSFDYHGYDMVPEFIIKCKEKFKNSKNINFSLVSPDETVPKNFDIVFASGVFNITSSNDKKKSKDYVFLKLKELFDSSNIMLICDFPSKYVDFEQDDAQHFSISEITDFCVENLSQKFIVRHDKFPYEFTLVAWKNGTIKRPENIFYGL